jgi:hypothetical protein
MTVVARGAGSVIFSLVIFAVTMLGGTASAHIKNDASQFPDIEFSDARFDIVILVGAGIIPETPVFEPDASLSLGDLAVWTALYNNLGEGGETPDTDALSKAALEQGLIRSLEGPATRDDINAIFFEGHLALEQQAASGLTKADAASFIAARFTTAEGIALLEKRGLEAGPTGDISLVEARTNPDGGSSYFITVGAMTMPMYSHGRVANGPTDLVQWQGRTVRKSFVRKQGDLTLWMYLEAEPIQMVAADPALQAGVDAANAEPVIKTNKNLLYGLIVGVLVLGVLLFFRRKRVS